MEVEIYLYNKVVMVTGAAGRIGSVISKRFAECGCDLILLETEYQKENTISLCEEFCNNYHIKCEYVICDLMDIENDQLKEQIDGFEKIDVLVNCAGANIIKPSLTIEEQEWDRVFNTNLKGTFFLTQKVARKALGSHTKLSVINIGSQHGVVGNVSRAPYCSSKGGLVVLTKALAVEWAKYKIRVNCVSPSFVISDNNREFLMSSQSKNEYLKNIPLGRYCEPEDVANTVLFLACSLSEYITGENILVDGGYTAR